MLTRLSIKSTSALPGLKSGDVKTVGFIPVAIALPMDGVTDAAFAKKIGELVLGESNPYFRLTL
jgi:hypothetical protein